MSKLPEFLIKTALIRGFELFRTDVRLIEQLFRNLTTESIIENTKFFQENVPQIEVNYPEDQPKLPALIILLRGENEEERFLADHGVVGVPEEFSYYGGVENEILGGTGSFNSLTGEPVIIFGPHYVFFADTKSLMIDSPSFLSGKFQESPHEVRIVKGKGKGQIREIESNSSNEIIIKEPWTLIPDETSVFEVVKPLEETWGEPQKLYDRNKTLLQQRTVLYRATCVINVIGANPEQAIIISVVTKAILLALRFKLEEQGLSNMRVSASDLTPRTDYAPTLAYTRSLTVEFSYEFDIFESLGPAIEQINVHLEKIDVNLTTVTANVKESEKVIDG